MTTHDARDHRIQTFRTFRVIDGPEREYAFGKFKVDQVGVFVQSHAYPGNRRSDVDINVYLSGPVTQRTHVKESQRERVESQVVPDPDNLSKRTKAWLGPIIQDAVRAHDKTMEAVDL